MKRIISYLKRIYRISLNFERQEKMMWQELKKLHTHANWKSGFYEKEKYIETIFEISEDEGATFYYMIYDGYFHCRVKVLTDYPIELTTDLFILAAHFNNLLSNGVVVVDIDNYYVEYHQKRDFLIPLLYNSEIYDQILRHHNTSKDIYAAFKRLVVEEEAPAIIIADLLKDNEAKEDEEK